MPTVTPPMFISSRLMAALKIDGAGEVHLEADQRTIDNRVNYRTVIVDAEGRELYDGRGISSGVGNSVDYTAAMETTLSFLEHDGDLYRSCMGDWASADEDSKPLWNEAVAEWAYQHDMEISSARLDLEDQMEQR